MILIPNLELFSHEEGSVFIEVTIKTIKVGSMINKLYDIESIELVAGGAVYKLQPSKDKEHWFSSTYYTFLQLVENYSLNVFLNNNTVLPFNCGTIYWKHLPSIYEVAEDAV